MEATARQTFAIFCMTGYDVRPCNLTKDQASDIISSLKRGMQFIPPPGAILKQVKEPIQDFSQVYREACMEAEKAFVEKVPIPMVVQEHANMMDDNSPVQKEWIVNDWVCGFAWIVIKPGTCAFAKWLRKNVPDLVHKDYYGGLGYHPRFMTQSMEKKEAYCHKWCEVIAEKIPGIRIYTQSRMD